MLAQSPPRPFLASESDARRALNMGIDLSPSQLVTHPAPYQPQDFQSLVDAHGQNSSGYPETFPLEQRLLLQTLASIDLVNPAFVAQTSLHSQAHSSEHSAPQSSSSRHVVNPREFLPSLPVNTATVNASFKLSDEVSPLGSSSTSCENILQTSVGFSRGTDGFGSDSPKSAPAGAVSFGRLNHAARQRTAQACEKCRDRKTKCSGTRPTCKRCADRGLSCVWAADTRVRGPPRQPRQLRFELGDNTGEPLSVLPVPLSEPSSAGSSPSPRGRDFVQSAPALQTTFPAIALPSHLLMRDQRKRQSWNDGMIRTGGVARGLSALSIMGEPIRPLTSFDDCWHSVESASLETPGRDRGTTIRARERRSSVSVAHLARARSLRDEAHPLPESQAPGFLGFSGVVSPVLHYSGESSNDPSPPLGGLRPTSSSETSESEATLSYTTSQHSSEHELHQPLPSYDTGSQLSDEMIKLLNFPGAHNTHGLLDVPPFAEIAHVNSDVTGDPIVLPALSVNETKENTEEVFAQYFDTDAFDSNKMQE